MEVGGGGKVDVGVEVGVEVAVGSGVFVEVGVGVQVGIGVKVGSSVGTDVGSAVGTEVGIGIQANITRPITATTRTTSLRIFSLTQCRDRGKTQLAGGTKPGIAGQSTPPSCCSPRWIKLGRYWGISPLPTSTTLSTIKVGTPWRSCAMLKCTMAD